MRQIKFSTEFVEEWDAISFYIESNFGLTKAIEVGLDLQKLVNTLSIFPEIGKVRIEHSHLRTFTFKGNILIFSFTDNIVNILSIIDRKLIK